MAYLAESPVWEEGIHQIETNERVLGGADGVANAQAKGLAARTVYLKEKLENSEEGFAEHLGADNPHSNSAPVESPGFTGIPTAPTAPLGTNTTQIATTGYVQNEVDDVRSESIMIYSSIPIVKSNQVVYVVGKGALEWQTFGSWQGYARLDVGAYYPDGTQIPRSFTIDVVGDTFSKAAYPALWAWAQASGCVVSSGAWAKNQFNFVDMGSVFRVPDMRDTVVRATGTDLDNANARVLGSYQRDALQNLTGSFHIRRALSLNDLTGSVDQPTGIIGVTNVSNAYHAFDLRSSSSEPKGGHTVSFDASKQARTSTETRGPNTAFAPRIIAF